MNEQRRRARGFILAVACVAIALLGRGTRTPDTAETPRDTATALLSAPAPAGFARAEAVRPLEFPRDHAAHGDYRTEWWYFTGHLVDASARRFGFQLTLFRFELDPHADALAGDSAWRTPRILLGHFALTDIAGDRFFSFERLSRALPGIAGASTSPPARVWLDDWRIEQRSAAPGHWHLRAREQGVALDLQLETDGPLVAQGDGGLSAKSAAAGNASYYYSVPRLSARGTLSLDARDIAVTGQAWLDREWSTSALAADQQGWDWFALSFDDHSSLMFYRLRRNDGSADRYSAGSYVDSDGAVTALAADDVELEVLNEWVSPVTAIAYPAEWRLRVARLELDVTLTPTVAAQEWRQRFPYWEGSATIAGRSRGAAIGGQAYVEMTGYPRLR